LNDKILFRSRAKNVKKMKEQIKEQIKDIASQYGLQKPMQTIVFRSEKTDCMVACRG
jgi:hypothetical protein